MHQIALFLVLLNALSCFSNAFNSTDIVCKVTAVAKHNLDMPEDKFFLCDGIANNWLTFSLNVDPESRLMRIQDWNAPKLLYIAFPPEWITYTDEVPTVEISAGDSVEIVTPKDATASADIPTRRLKGDATNVVKGQVLRRRSLRTAKGNANALIVLVSTADASPPKGYDAASLELAKAAEQIADCSNYNFRLNTAGIIDVKLGKNSSAYSATSIYLLAKAAVQNYFGLLPYQDPVTELGIQHIMYHVPIGLIGDIDGYGVSFGAIGGTFTVFQNQLFTATVILHELGHNYNLNHARESLSSNPDGDNTEDPEYGDDSGLMGTSFFIGLGDRTLKRCFNGANFYELGWYRNATVEITLSSSGEFRAIPLVSFTNRNAMLVGQAAVIKFGNFFITYNQKTGANIQTVELANKVIVVEVTKTGYTDLRAVLDTPSGTGDRSYNASGTNVEVCGSHSDKVHLLLANNVTCANLPIYCFNDPDTTVKVAKDSTSWDTKLCMQVTSQDCQQSNSILGDGTPPVWQVCAGECRSQSGC